MIKGRQPYLEFDGTKSSTELPPFTRFIDVLIEGSNRNESTRVYFATPTRLEMHNLPKHIVGVVGAGNRPKHNQNYTGIEEFIGKLITPEFAREHCQLMELSLSAKPTTKKRLSRIVICQKHFAKYLGSNEKTSKYTSILNISIEDWIGFRDYLMASKLIGIKGIYNFAVKPFLSYAPTNFSNALFEIGSPNKSRLSPEHTSIFVEPNAGYSDSTMYQLLANFLFHFYRGISYLERYNALSAETMPEIWIDPTLENIKENRNNREKKFNLLKGWLASEGGYQIILDHKLYFHKLGLRGYRAFNMVMNRICKGTDQMESLRKYNEWEKNYHYLNSGRKSHVGSLYSKNASDDTGGKYLEFCLANIVLIYTGLNKEVLLSWPSQIGGKSILVNYDTLFLTSQEKATDIIIPGTKARTGTATHTKVIRTVVNIKSPLYTMLKLYEKFAKNDFDGPFFEMNETRKTKWTRADFTKKFPIYLDDETLLKSIDTTKFRKVYATAKLLEHLEGAKTANDVAEKLRLALSHDSFNTTLQHYLLRSKEARGVIDVAIASLTEEKLLQSIHFHGQVNTEDKTPYKKLYLCECTDPTAPSHDLPIADECTYYDNCLGCKRSVISTNHLPYICFRILQYAQAQKDLGITWNVVYEDKWLIAWDALDKFKQSYPEMGESIVNEAWAVAKSGAISLPAIFTKS